MANRRAWPTTGTSRACAIIHCSCSTSLAIWNGPCCGAASTAVPSFGVGFCCRSSSDTGAALLHGSDRARGGARQRHHRRRPRPIPWPDAGVVRGLREAVQGAGMAKQHLRYGAGRMTPAEVRSRSFVIARGPRNRCRPVVLRLIRSENPRFRGRTGCFVVPRITSFAPELGLPLDSHFIPRRDLRYGHMRFVALSDVKCTQLADDCGMATGRREFPGARRSR